MLSLEANPRPEKTRVARYSLQQTSLKKPGVNRSCRSAGPPKSAPRSLGLFVNGRIYDRMRSGFHIRHLYPVRCNQLTEHHAAIIDFDHSYGRAVRFHDPDKGFLRRIFRNRTDITPLVLLKRCQVRYPRMRLPSAPVTTIDCKRGASTMRSPVSSRSVVVPV